MKYLAQYRQDIFDGGFDGEPILRYISRSFEDFKSEADALDEAEIVRRDISNEPPFSRAFLLEFKSIT